jgi:hypothetical protein
MLLIANTSNEMMAEVRGVEMELWKSKFLRQRGLRAERGRSSGGCAHACGRVVTAEPKADIVRSFRARRSVS